MRNTIVVMIAVTATLFLTSLPFVRAQRIESPDPKSQTTTIKTQNLKILNDS
jgi:hypothetical protein